MTDSLWFTTRSTLFAADDSAWREVARYEAPLRRLLAGHCAGRLGQADREDLLQDILIEIKQDLAGRHDPDRGKFRALLQTVVRRRVIDRLRRRRELSPAEGVLEAAESEPAGELDPEAFVALDLEARLIEAVAACRDSFSGGPGRDLDVLYTLVDRLVHGRSSVEIAREQGVSRDVISRRLQKGRDVIFAHLLSAELSLPPGAELTRAVTVFKKLLRRPRARRAILDELPAGPGRDGLNDLWTRFQAALPRFQGDLTVAGRELSRGVALVFDEEAREDGADPA